MAFVEIYGIDKIVSRVFCPSCNEMCEPKKEDMRVFNIKCEGRDVSVVVDVICAKCGHIFSTRLSYSLKDITPFDLP